MHDLIDQTSPDVVIGADGSAYRLLDLVGRTAGALLFRAHSTTTGRGAVVKLLDPAMMVPARIESFKREFNLLHRLDVTGVVKPVALAEGPQRLAMILEDMDAEPLEVVLPRQRLDVTTCLRLACQLARILSDLHAAQVIHRDIRPANLMLFASGEICLVDLYLATVEAIETATVSRPAVGDWAYVSPEQTGRMSRPVDLRTDFYSFGVTLYQMLTGQLPHQGRDALELVHCHIARLPRPAADLDPGIPPALSALVTKLLAKMPEERYQRAQGLLHDLKHCLAQWESGGVIEAFVLGSRDWPERLQAPPQLFGRAPETRQVLASFEAMEASGRAALLLVSGDAGVGKTALVHALYQPAIARHAYFISGKFDQYQRDIPYATVTQAFRELVQQILAESDVRIAEWRQKIEAAVGANGQLIIDVLPQIGLIVGTQTPVPELPAAEAQNRFRMVFKQFIGVFAQASHPLTLFLDDLQWADSGSLRLVGELVSSLDRRCLLVVGAYRDQEVGPGHPLLLTLEQMRSDAAVITRIALAPLPEAVLCDLLGDMLQSDCVTVRSLSHLVFRKTAGNPFFVTQFMTALADERMLVFDPVARRWRWDLAKIDAKGYTDNVAELMIGKLARLPATTQAALQRLACLGAGTAQDTLVLVCDQPSVQTLAALSNAVSAGLVVRAGSAITFTHDRVQEAVYLSMPAATRAELHLQIGHLLMAGKTPADIEDAIFSIVSQFNRATTDATVEGGVGDGRTADDKALLCQLNFLAGKKAKATIAYATARIFLDRAFRLLPADAWHVSYPDCFAISLALSECEYLVGNFQRAEELASLILLNVQSKRDRASVYRLRTQLYQMAGSYDDALATMSEAAGLFDVVFPADGQDMEAAIDAESQEIATLLRGRRILDFADAPLLADANLQTVIALLVETLPAAYLTRPDYFAFITAKVTQLSMRFGATEDACFGYSAYGMALLCRRSDIATAFEFSELALKLNQRLDGRRLKGWLLVAYALAFSPWKNTFATSTTILDQACAASVDVGDLLYANFSAMVHFWPMLQEGAPLDAVLATAREKGAFARDSQNDAVYQTIRFQQQLVANLKGDTRGWASLDDDNFNEMEAFAALQKTNMGFGLQMVHIVKQISAFIYGDHAAALTAAQRASSKSYEGNGMILVDSVHHFYFALTLAALYPQATGSEQQHYAGLLAEELERHRVWAEHNPQNFQWSYALIAAEVARIEGRPGDAAPLFEQAIAAAQDSGFVHNEAIAFEVTASFYRARDFRLIADTYLLKARTGYLRWGADGKVARLDGLHPQLRLQGASASPALPDNAVTQLDVLAVAKAAQAISGRLVLDELADMLLQIALQNAGAQTAALLLCGSDGLTFAAQADIAGAEVQVRTHARQAPAEDALPRGMLNYVRRSRERVLLPDVAQTNPFSADSYFAGHHPKSVLCLPILRQEVLIGMLYLENNLVTHAFALERVAVLELLASQAAISLENAQLYSNLILENGNRQRAEEALRDTDRRKDEFLAMLAHELRNPLAPIGTAAQLLSHVGYDAKRGQKVGEIISRQVIHMTSLIDDLLDVSRVTTGRVVLDRHPLDINQIVAESMEQVGPLIDARKHRFTVHAAPQPAIVLGDRKRLVQVITNLLQNATKFTPEHGNIALHVARHTDEIVITVRDDGIGIEASLLPHVFELFAQEKRSSDRSQGGLGLGLTLVRSLVVLHGGRVGASSDGVGEGATFTIHLPQWSKLPEHVSSAHDNPVIAPAKPLHVLIVDDNVDAANMLAMFLEVSGHRVSVEYEPWAALERAKIETPDVFLLDIGLPDMDGNELARRLRLQPRLANATYIAVTGYGQKNTKGEPTSSEFDHHLVKPADTTRLLGLLTDIEAA